MNVGTTKGQIIVTYGNKANTAITGKTLILSAITNKGSMQFSCNNIAQTVSSKYLPSSCR